jgi:predicted O-linked N-acetylglucosamine transferase (SPINDLY family)
VLRASAGVPCVTLAGGCHAHNVGVSLMTAVGLSEQWVARTEQEYVDLAVRAALDVEVSKRPRAPCPAVCR